MARGSGRTTGGDHVIHLAEQADLTKVGHFLSWLLVLGENFQGEPKFMNWSASAGLFFR